LETRVIAVIVIVVPIGVIGIVEAAIGARVAISLAIGPAIRFAIALFITLAVLGVAPGTAAALRNDGISRRRSHQRTVKEVLANMVVLLSGGPKRGKHCG
jgi:hypothetical protein